MMNNITKILLLAFLSLVLVSCGKSDRLEILQYTILDAQPTTFSSFHVKVNLQISNKGSKLSLSDIEGVAKRRNTVLGTFSANPVEIPAKTIQWVEVEGDLQIDKNVSLVEILLMAKNFKPEEYSLTYKFKARSGIGPKFIIKGEKQLKDLIGEK